MPTTISGTTGASQVQDNSITTGKIANGTIIGGDIAGSTITNTNLSLAANDGEIKKALNANNPPPIYACRAWVRFDGTRDTSGAISTANTPRRIIAAGNVSSVLRTAAGIYTVTFTIPMPTVNYAAVATARHATGITYACNADTSSLLAESLIFVSGYQSSTDVGTPFDTQFGDLAVFA
jgi:hypothetical protein